MRRINRYAVAAAGSVAFALALYLLTALPGNALGRGQHRARPANERGAAMSGRTDISPDTQETNISKTTPDDADSARIVACDAGSPSSECDRWGRPRVASWPCRVPRRGAIKARWPSCPHYANDRAFRSGKEPEGAERLRREATNRN
jgi:hypothetical protein